MCFGVSFRACFNSVLPMAQRHKFTLQERIFLISNYYRYDADHRQIQAEFHACFPNRPIPTRNYIYKLHVKFQTLGNVADAPRSGRRRSARTEENQQLVAQAFIDQPTRSLRRTAPLFDFSRRSLQRIAHELQFHAYRPRLLQALHEGDYQQRVNFCEWYLIRKGADPTFAESILWSDEAIFKLNGRVNRWNSVYWADENPHVIMEEELNLPGVMVWCGVNQRGILGPYFFDGNVLVNGERYVECLEELVLALEEDPRFAGRDIIFQQDGAPAHFTLVVRNFLNEWFPEWIGRGGTIAWHPRSPDLTCPVSILVFGGW